MTPVQSFAAFAGRPSWSARLRATARRAALLALSLAPGRGRGGALRFPYYHHVFEDERATFARQLRWMRRQGEYLGWDDAVALVQSGQPIDGRYFCISFDDGFRNCVTHALPILVEHGATVAFFLATSFIDTDPVRDRDRLLGFYPGESRLMEFLDWDECRQLLDSGMVVGSHTDRHARLAELDSDGVASELSRSKHLIEAELGLECRHFCAPWGEPLGDFDP
ncbi:MAG: polysaccharide deacetylase family protein [Proteobacteria bacterium]|nr:polysaccharide deacetylase family protein [Pseudomonadota bacterium]